MKHGGVKKYARNLETEMKSRKLQNHGQNLGSLTPILILIHSLIVWFMYLINVIVPLLYASTHFWPARDAIGEDGCSSLQSNREDRNQKEAHHSPSSVYAVQSKKQWPGICERIKKKKKERKRPQWRKLKATWMWKNNKSQSLQFARMGTNGKILLLYLIFFLISYIKRQMVKKKWGQLS